MAGIILFTISILCVIAGIIGRNAAKNGSPFRWRKPKERMCDCGGKYRLIGTGDNAAIFQCMKCGGQLKVSLEFVKFHEKSYFTIREVDTKSGYAHWKLALTYPDNEGDYLVILTSTDSEKKTHRLTLLKYLGNGIWENKEERFNEVITYYFDCVIPEVSFLQSEDAN